jgi:CRP/FNR family cyclic AMP-dependent transcriptional regulator
MLPDGGGLTARGARESWVAAMPQDAELGRLTGRDAILGLLASHRVLRGLAQQDLEHLLAFSQVRHFRRRTQLFVAGQPGSSVYVVLSGYVKLSRANATGREIVVELAGPGSLFGELAVINGWPRSADAVALSDCRMLAIDGRHYMDALRRNPEAMLATIRHLSERLTATTLQMEDALFLPAPARLARVLIRLAAQHSQPTRDGLQIDIAISQRELGDITGLARESINKQLAAWRDERIIRLDGQHVTLTNATALQQIAHLVGNPAAA